MRELRERVWNEARAMPDATWEEAGQVIEQMAQKRYELLISGACLHFHRAFYNDIRMGPLVDIPSNDQRTFLTPSLICEAARLTLEKFRGRRNG